MGSTGGTETEPKGARKGDGAAAGTSDGSIGATREAAATAVVIFIGACLGLVSTAPVGCCRFEGLFCGCLCCELLVR